ncbi:hypothetical protein E1258_11070 [Micromonospora sp. KC207]|uniref:8-oxoguanine DNA glycosylase OGG fold protein n=1 Tax=Micromonospora sp. KC207 TaxID=2530377 RepID=UPI0010500E57|nr:hypothetical protein [Micromonospora sp. KC207]TDC61557.1 hypothetical protein E1258_11070 [Micromonospora sp. KC207]
MIGLVHVGGGQNGEPVKLPHDASPFDRGVVEGGLTPGERDWFRRQRRERAQSSVCRYADVTELTDQHRIPVDLTRWAQLGEHLPVPPGAGPVPVSRRDVTEVARHCRENRVWLPLLAASFAWGWGRRGFGPTRLTWILHGNTRWPAPPPGEVERRLAHAVDVLDHESAWSAYRYLAEEDKVCGLGPAFFTKFLYFAGRAGDRRPGALILDDRLAGRMRGFWLRRADETYAAQGKSPHRLWRGSVWSPYRYHVYLAFLGRAAVQLAEDGEQWTPELVELLLFRSDPDATGAELSFS